MADTTQTSRHGRDTAPDGALIERWHGGANDPSGTVDVSSAIQPSEHERTGFYPGEGTMSDGRSDNTQRKDDVEHLVPAPAGHHAPYQRATREVAEAHFEVDKVLRSAKLEAEFDDLVAALGFFQLIWSTKGSAGVDRVRVTLNVELNDIDEWQLKALEALTNVSWNVLEFSPRVTHI